MRNLIKLAAIVSATGTFLAFNVPAQPAPGGGPHYHGGMDTNRMEWRKEMMEEHQKTMAEMKTMDATLEKDVAKMNQAQGSAKTDAMQTVINDLVKEHNFMRDRMNEMHQRMMTHMQQRQQMMGGGEQGAGGSSSGSNTQPGNQ